MFGRPEPEGCSINTQNPVQLWAQILLNMKLNAKLKALNTTSHSAHSCLCVSVLSVEVWLNAFSSIAEFGVRALYSKGKPRGAW